ncbi:cell division protein FtsQ/DivIB [Listeria sp. PSOL-1]|uniref:cell division protein FtsQ/DivIB n=1 Tax=Listeria sp. PSOL-1 TaxID=1844999 RepID=UPI0013D1B88F|nr:cell division protein FtsQ/DivIB [Listeria sp. PSOL-1]
MAENKKIVSIEKRIPELRKYRKKKLVRHLAILIGFFAILILITLYFLSPFSKVGGIYVNGTKQLTENEVRAESGIKEKQFVFAINNKKVSQTLQKNKLIKKAEVKKEGINHYQINITENNTIGYQQKGALYYDILENGYLMNSRARKFPIGNQMIFVGFKNGETLKAMVKELKQLPEDVKQAISEIHLQPEKNDKERILLYMNDGNKVSATISSFAEKMKYYPSIVGQLKPGQKGTIDLEVGSYFQSYYKQNQENKEQEKKK